VKALRKLYALWALLALLGVPLPAGAPTVAPVPSKDTPIAVPAPDASGHYDLIPGQRYIVPKPSCVAFKLTGDYKAWCATTHGDVVSGGHSSMKAANAAAERIYARELKAQGGQLR
jgi:hypothetical protein